MHIVINKTRKVLSQNTGYDYTKGEQSIVHYLVSPTFILRAFSSFSFSYLQSYLWFLFPTMNHIQLIKLLSSIYLLLNTNNFFFLYYYTQSIAYFTCQGMKSNAATRCVRSHQIARLDEINNTPTTSARSFKQSL